MAWGFNPYLIEREPLSRGAYLAVVESRRASWSPAGFDARGRLPDLPGVLRAPARRDPQRWGKPARGPARRAHGARSTSASRAIGGKDSMSGSFEELDVPPTLVSLRHRAVGTVGQRRLARVQGAPATACSLIVPDYGDDGLTARACLAARRFDLVRAPDRARGGASPSPPLGYGGAAEAALQDVRRQPAGLRARRPPSSADALFAPAYGSFVVELADGAELPRFPGHVTVLRALAPRPRPTSSLRAARRSTSPSSRRRGRARSSPCFPYRAEDRPSRPSTVDVASAAASALDARRSTCAAPARYHPGLPGHQLRVRHRARLRARRRRGRRSSSSTTSRPRPSPRAVDELAQPHRARARSSCIPGGFSGGDEPDGSAQVHHRVLPRARGHRGRARAAADSATA